MPFVLHSLASHLHLMPSHAVHLVRTDSCSSGGRRQSFADARSPLERRGGQPRRREMAKTAVPMQRFVLYVAILCWHGFTTLLAFSSHSRARCSGYVCLHEPESMLWMTNSFDRVERSEKSTSEERQQKEQKWILLVEDDKALRDKIGDHLANEGGYFVTGVPDARSAILVCRGAIRTKNKVPESARVGKSKQLLSRPDCLVLDLRLSGSMNGLDLLKVVRSDPTIEFLPVILLAERGRAEDRLEGYDAGADAFLLKPFDLDELLALIDGLVKRDRFSSRLTRGNDGFVGSAVIKSEELRREILEIKRLLMDLGFQKNMTLNGAKYNYINDGSTEQILLEIKDTIRRGSMHENSSEIDPEEESNEDTSARDTKYSMLLPDEVAILNLIDQGMTNKEIASTTKLSLDLITKKLNGMFKKVKVKNKTELLQWWKKYQQNFG
ncbi:hypothetical protein HJC23_007100 [Cyclotella cryptica]|uniref:Response regulatory domain-containing protein n=1 Tax=Cyclotella cryptica TaxID=29204 RepID=A0ABD3P047_9STRA|eukprot:CCRYP_018373-RC/>CCRYP_018373-RC protein AED:0.02 eAED:0.02 QI:257/1/1/1/0.33/0.28/7/3452/438